jgi:hypothetical protein
MRSMICRCRERVSAGFGGMVVNYTEARRHSARRRLKPGFLAQPEFQSLDLLLRFRTLGTEVDPILWTEKRINPNSELTIGEWEFRIRTRS